MPAIRAMGFDEKGNFFIEPNWVAEGLRIGMSVDEIATIENTGQPLSSLIFHVQNALPFVESPVIKDPTKAANAKAQTLQTRLDGLIDTKGDFRVGQVVVVVSKDATQSITIADPGATPPAYL